MTLTSAFLLTAFAAVLLAKADAKALIPARVGVTAHQVQTEPTQPAINIVLPGTRAFKPAPPVQTASAAWGTKTVRQDPGAAVGKGQARK